ncbi:LpxL/LpxP family Kdo(2)-lipid IV(A) lauroyl/palmitoleoyl acyltransferase [Pseudoalteromonas sp. T1lg75]|uniref:LpxL/LpxP family Kdo(2)-lipid IV(A) lauroyl/palmitoleoyl acyltransferase n=1 Tax=Pseudoalteromonas sp. T1lg75 TaxID=2077102 RepID=UPI003FA357B9
MLVVNKTSFQLAFFAPKYWPSWLSVFLLYTLSWLPQSWQLALGRALGRLVYRLMKKRRKIAEVNIALCYPDLNAEQRAELVLKNMENTGMAIFESAMAWWWPDWRIKRIFGSVTGLEHVDAAQQQGQGVLLLVPHMLHLEMASRIMGVKRRGIGFYRPHNNALMDYFTTKGRLRSNEYLVGKRDVKSLLKALKDKKFCYYLPDQDYGRKRSVFAPFFAVPDAASTTGTLIFAASKYCQTLSISTRRDEQGKYHLAVQPALENFPSGDEVADVTQVNKRMEQAINMAPEQYMWLHRRFKTRPDKNAPSYYR